MDFYTADLETSKCQKFFYYLFLLFILFLKLFSWVFCPKQVLAVLDISNELNLLKITAFFTLLRSSRISLAVVLSIN